MADLTLMGQQDNTFFNMNVLVITLSIIDINDLNIASVFRNDTMHVIMIL